MRMMIRALIFTLFLSVAPAAAGDSAEANRIFVEAMGLIQGALKKPEGSATVANQVCIGCVLLIVVTEVVSCSDDC